MILQDNISNFFKILKITRKKYLKYFEQNVLKKAESRKLENLRFSLIFEYPRKTKQTSLQFFGS